MGLLATIREEAWLTVAESRKAIMRYVEFPAISKVINVAIGMRRSGKSYFLYQTINQLLDNGIEKEQILFLNFEDDRLLPMDAKEMGKLIDSFYRLYPQNHHRRCYLFLDEVQNVENWHLPVRRYFDSKNVEIYITGSSAKLLGNEINTSLRGRSLSVEVFPFNFQEYLSANSVQPVEKPLGQISLDMLYQHFLKYLAVGGFPAAQLLPKHKWRETLRGYLDSVILRDIVERHNVTNITLLEYLTRALVKSVASVFSVNKFYNDIKSQGFSLNKHTLHNYLDYLQDAFLVFRVTHFSESERIKQTRPKKLYVVDSGLVNAISLTDDGNLGRLFENLVYLDLRRRNKTIYFYTTKDGYEVDFVTIDPDGNKELLQVTWDMEDEATKQHEWRALEQAEAELGIKGRVLTVWDYLSGDLI